MAPTSTTPHFTGDYQRPSAARLEHLRIRPRIPSLPHPTSPSTPRKRRIQTNHPNYEERFAPLTTQMITHILPLPQGIQAR